jgi:hypothetical protein
LSSLARDDYEPSAAATAPQAVNAATTAAALTSSANASVAGGRVT